ncbi:MAG TPA: ribonuclease H-like domain-containing protein, partial [Candidatus Krumholzibacteria bacterium]|nr:ribonuclease H-like domain-containing protein [Candidatus Krumholzibacteria bacterium]
MENRLKKQLALIKARAMTIARRAAISTDAPSTEPGSDSADTGSASCTPAINPVIEHLIRVGTVTRASQLAAHSRAVVARGSGGPWWWRRRLGRASEDLDPVAREARRTTFESQFQDVLGALTLGEMLTIENAVPGEHRIVDGAGYYLVRRNGRDIDPIAPLEAGRFAGFSAWPEPVTRTMVGRFVRRGYAAQGLAEVPSDLAGGTALRGADPRSILFLDIETAGLAANTYAFLCGLMYFQPDTGEFVVEQAFARDYAEEEGLLLHVREALGRFDTVVTYNGSSFDLPFLRTRMAVHRIPDIVPMGSVDLLHATRRVFRPELPNVRLVTVEAHLRGVARVDDIPSRFIPRAYHEYVRTQDARIIRNIVYHNRMDIFTMAVILNHLVEQPLTVALQPQRLEGNSPRPSDSIAG